MHNNLSIIAFFVAAPLVGDPAPVVSADQRDVLALTATDAGIRVKSQRMDTGHEDSVWLSLWLLQCEPAVPDLDARGDGVSGSYPTEELLQVDNFFESQGIDLLQLGYLWSAEGLGTCAACGCPSLTYLIVQASEADAPHLMADYGFEQIPRQELAGLNPEPCRKNPWDDGQPPADTFEEFWRVGRWADTAGVPLRWAGFTYSTEPDCECSKCSCPVGNLLVVWPYDMEQAASLGFVDLYAMHGPSKTLARFTPAIPPLQQRDRHHRTGIRKGGDLR